MLAPKLDFDALKEEPEIRSKGEGVGQGRKKYSPNELYGLSKLVSAMLFPVLEMTNSLAVGYCLFFQ